MAQDLSPVQRTPTADVLGAGTVGNQVTRLPTEQADDFAARSGVRLEITGIAARNVNAPRDLVAPQDLLTDDTTTTTTDNDLVIELIGGIEPARTFILAAFKAGASAITGNKALVAVHGPELHTAVAAADTDLYYEAAVAGAIPAVYALYKSMAGDRVISVLGIVNGITNYILDEMSTKGLSFETALATTQEFDYTEADPTTDVNGLDAAAKTAIIASLAFHTRVGLDDASVKGVREVITDDIRETHASGCELKLPAITQRRDDEHAQGVSVRVHPAPVPNDHPLASVHGAYNVVLVEAENAECLMFYGQGVGGAPTASVVLSDVVAAAAHRVHGGQAPRESSHVSLWALGPEATIIRYQIQLRLDSAVGSLAAIAPVFAESEVSINSARQSTYVTFDGSHDQTVVIFVTHPVPVFHLDAAVEDLRDPNRVVEVAPIQRVKGK